MDDRVLLKGRINLKLISSTGQIKEERDISNVVVSVGKNYLATWLAAASQAGKFMSYIGIGTGTNAASASDTDLQTPLSTRVLGTLSSSSNVWQNQATFTAGTDTGAITEAGLFSASSSGTMFAHQVFPVINKQSGDSLQITWNITFN